MYTPENITELQPDQIIVVGTNMAGNHAGGAARQARESFGLQDGVGEGISGQTYAFPTLNKDFSKRTLGQIRDSVMDLYECAKYLPDKTFLVTKVGTGIAGYSIEEIKECFQDYDKPENVVLPREFSN